MHLLAPLLRGLCRPVTLKGRVLRVPQSSVGPSTEQVLGKRRAPLTETQLETLYGDVAMNLMRKMWAFDDGVFKDPKRQLIKEAKHQLICTNDEWATMDQPRKKKGKREEDPPVHYGKWKCHACGVSYDGGPGWEKSRSRYWYCPNCTTQPPRKKLKSHGGAVPYTSMEQLASCSFQFASQRYGASSKHESKEPPVWSRGLRNITEED